MTRRTRALVTVALAAAVAGIAAAPAMADNHIPTAPGFTAQDSHTPITGAFTTDDSHIPIAPAGATQH
ncbi:hypothetical protein AB0G35_18480 [Streptomyces sp. NPDC021749]|uniref:hypothetical protein n=1 Tax=Streptomyces sp. NPDC021749 TaxID=3154905 RepID=UPI0033D1B7AF